MSSHLYRSVIRKGFLRSGSLQTTNASIHSSLLRRPTNVRYGYQYFATTSGKDGSGSTDDNSSSSISASATDSKKQTRPQRPKKENFAKKFLEPAARGELSKHQSGIPKLAARKTKGHSVKDDFPGKNSQDALEAAANLGREDGGQESGRGRQQDNNGGRGGRVQGRGGRGQGRGGRGQGRGGRGRGQAPPRPPTPPPPSQEMILSPLFEGVQPEELDPTLNQNNRTWLGRRSSHQQSRFQEQRNVGRNQRTGRDGRPQKNYDMWGDEELEGDEPWETDAVSYTYRLPHAESRREPYQIVFPASRKNPPDDFVEAHGAFIYVANAPHPVIDGELGSYDNPLHRHEVTEFVANALAVPAADVFAANMTSAFVGFKDAKEAATNYVASEAKRIITTEKIEANIYSAKDEEESSSEVKDFISSTPNPDALVSLEHMPAGMNSWDIAKLLHNVVKIDNSDILLPTATTVLVRLSSSDEASALIKNRTFQEVLSSCQRQILRVHSVRRETVHDKYGGPLRQIQMRKMTNKLVVDGDLPTKDFFLSHSKVLHLSHVPTNVTKGEISAYFQTFCVEPRDIEGSIEIVKSVDGHHVERVYVGFDYEFEGDAAWEHICASGQKIKFDDHGAVARVRLVKEKKMIRGTKLGARSERSQEELVASFTEWKNHINPEDLKFLESHGVTMDVLEETFKAARHNSTTFTVEDQARKGERMRDEFGPGEHFHNFVKDYVEVLKDVVTSKEDPGLMYEAMFMPDEEVDFDLFDEEDKRLTILREQSEN